jgi:hypothetical protein
LDSPRLAPAYDTGLERPLVFHFHIGLSSDDESAGPS